MDLLLYFRTTPLRSVRGLNKPKDQRADRALCDPGLVHKLQDCLVLADPATRVQTAHPSGLVAQLVEHPLCKRGASGSNPDESTLRKERPGPRTSVRQICSPPDKMGCGNALGTPTDTGDAGRDPRPAPMRAVRII
jgi:hypothetical protein